MAIAIGDKERVKDLFNEAIQTKSDMDVMKEGLAELVKQVAKEMDIKPAILNKAINIAYKQSLTEEQENMSDIEELLAASGRANLLG